MISSAFALLKLCFWRTNIWALHIGPFKADNRVVGSCSLYTSLHLLLILAFVGPTLSPFSGLLVLIFDCFRIFIIYFPFDSFRLIKSHCCKRLNVVETIWKFVYSNNMVTVAGFTYSKRNANSCAVGSDLGRVQIIGCV